MSDLPVQFATWTEPGTGATVEYALPLFHEIDFVVNEGYRRIPHGGVETGGVLYGTSVNRSIRVEAFLPIDCEHASGPSFNLSDRDIEKLRTQIGTKPDDAAFEGLQVVGWFIAHTRSELILTDREAALWADLFPAASVTVLIKPEKFKATRFAFLTSASNRDARESSVVLPLPGRPSKPVSDTSIPNYSHSKSTLKPESEASIPDIRAFETAEKPDKPGSDTSIPEIFPRPESVTTHQLTEEPSRAQPLAFPAPELKGNAIPPPLPEYLQSRPAPPEPEVTTSGTFFWITIGAAVAFACFAAYGWYIRAIPAVIPLTLAPHGERLIVTWPSEATRNADTAAISLNNGAQVPLSPSERISGATSLPINKNGAVRVELVVRRWMRESRGIVQYVKAPVPNPSE